MLFGSAAAQGQESQWFVQSPVPAQRIQDGELFVSVAIEGEVPLDETSVQVILDGIDVTKRARITTSSVRLLYTSKLGPGRHDIEVTGALLSGQRLTDLAWHFEVEGEITAATPRRSPGARVADFRGKTLIDTRNADISGNRDLRQEPTRSYAVRADAEGSYAAFTFPVKLYLTTDESSVSQPRNRFMIGVEGPMFAAYAGDRNPRLAPLILNGARTRGFHGEFHGAGFHLETAIGRLRRGLEGRVLDTPVEEPLRQLPGTFQRNLTAVKLGFGHQESVLFSISGLKAKDDTTSIAFGENPLENLVLGSDLETRFLNGRLRFETGGAISITTNDISRGPATKAQIDSLFNTDIPIDPSDFDWLITLNASTVPIRLDKLKSTAWYFNTKVVVPGHTIAAELRTVGSAWYSAANPFLQPDRRTLTISDRFRVDGGRFSGLVRFQNYGSLSDGGERLKLTSNLVEGRVNIALRPDLPRFVTGLRMQWRERGTDPTDPVASDLQVSTASFGVTHTLKTGTVRHALNGFYTRTARRDKINSMFDNTTHAITLGATENFPKSIHTNLQLTHLIVNYAGELGRQRWTTLAGTVGYRFYNNDANVALTVRNTSAGATTFSAGSDRLGFILSGSLRLQNDMSIELQAGYDDYWEDVNNGNQYTEKFVRLRHRYTF
ncbi:MAG: hypothetical protein KJO98_08050 [Rhodothermia bacterium]|nr:hypothetical protein [Rhodothermia bacterium]